MAAGSEALGNPRVQRLENFSTTISHRDASFKNREPAGVRAGDEGGY